MTQFLAAIDGAIINRFEESDRQAREKIAVRYIFGPKERVMADIVNAAQNITVPAVAVNVTSIARDPNRVFNKNAQFYRNTSLQGGTGYITPTRMPQPVKIVVSLAIMTRYQVDLEQIASNFIPYFTPYIELATMIPSTVNPNEVIEVRTKATWDETLNITTPVNIDYAEKFARVGETTFTLDSWLYAKEEDLSKPIYFIDANFYAVKGKILDLTYEELSSGSYALSTYPSSVQHFDTVSLSAYPQLTNWFYATTGQMISVDYPFTIAPDSCRSFLFYGDNFQYIQNVMLSSNSITMYSNLTTINTEYYGSVTGYLLDPTMYSVLNSNMLQVTLPPLSATGHVDIVMNNIVGWSTSYNINQIHIDIE